MRAFLKAQPRGIRVLVAESSRMGCQLVSGALKKSHHRFEVVALTTRCEEAIRALEMHHPEVAVISARMVDGDHSGFDVLRALKKSSPKTRAILLLDSRNPKVVVQAFRDGAKGIFCRSESFDALCKCIQVVNQGQIWAASEDLQALLEAISHAGLVPMFSVGENSSLTKREREVIELVAQGLTNREISGELKLSPHTIKNYLFRIFDKLGMSRRVELAHYAHHSGGDPGAGKDS